ncbi:MAG: hypothetical protein JRJ57_10955 [Deltaproteobacteria bacterium]|nr:hypothetical protein [Deltaproteobacteria bacterium]RLG17058.1 MAG: hypothetical protein DRN75_04185 [Nanoarchaeota archaeon]
MEKKDTRREKDQEIKDYKKRERDRAISLVKQWSDIELKDYIQPTRTGTPKGDPIGFSHKKYQAAHLMILHPQALKIKDIAKITETSEGVLRVWRVEKEFKKSIEEFGILVASRITDIIETIVDSIENKESAIFSDGEIILKPKNKQIQKNKFKKNFTLKFQNIPVDSVDNLHSLSMILLGLLPFFNSSVIGPFAKWMKKSIDSSGTSSYAGLIYPSLAEYALKEASVYDIESLRKWETKPEVLEITKMILNSNIDFLVNPEIWKLYDPKKIQETAESLKKLITNKLELFAQFAQ